MEPQASNKHCQPHHFCQAVMVNVAFFHQMDLLSEKLSKQTLQAKFFQPAWVVNYPEAEVQKFKSNLIDPRFKNNQPKNCEHSFQSIPLSR